MGGRGDELEDDGNDEDDKDDIDDEEELTELEDADGAPPVKALIRPLKGSDGVGDGEATGELGMEADLDGVI